MALQCGIVGLPNVCLLYTSHHEHEHESNSVQIDRYHEAFNKFEPALPDTQATETVNALLEKHFQENFTPEVLKTIHGCIDLTSLTSLDLSLIHIWNKNDFQLRRNSSRRRTCRL